MNGFRIDALLGELAAAARARQMRKRALAKAAGLHVNTLRHFAEPAWQPTVETIRSLERVLLPRPPVVQSHDTTSL